MAAPTRQCASALGPVCLPFFGRRNVSVLDQPPYNPNLATWNFFLFPRFKGIIKRIRFVDVEAIKEAVTRELRAIPKQAFHDCMASWQRHMGNCVEKQGDYFERCERRLEIFLPIKCLLPESPNFPDTPRNLDRCYFSSTDISFTLRYILIKLHLACLAFTTIS